MADYDVGVVSLSSPPSTGPVQQYRPAVQVRNYGVHDALASGVLRIYSAGLLRFTSELYSGTIAPGHTEPALTTDYWTPETPGTYIVIADVTCPLDQVESNNHLGPTTIIITGLPPPPPPTVPYHASMHEDGGPDELLADGLHGLLADPQTPLGHKTRHQAGGNDMLNVDGLPGTLAQGQPIADHHPSHENGGGDEMSVEGLGGVLVNLQKPQVHDNTKHDPNYAVSPHNNASHDPDYVSVSELAAHLADTTDVHEVATNLEHLANKNQASGYCGLGANTLVPSVRLAPMPIPPPANYVLRSDQTWGEGAAGPHAPTHELAGADELSIAGLSGKAADAQDPLGHHVSHEPGGSDVIDVLVYSPACKSASCNSIYGDDPPTLLISQALPAALASDNLTITSRCIGDFSPGVGKHTLQLLIDSVPKLAVDLDCHLSEYTDFDCEFTTIFYPTGYMRTSARLLLARTSGTSLVLIPPTTQAFRPTVAFTVGISDTPAATHNALLSPEMLHQTALPGAPP